MSDTKDNILMTALHLFAQDGYEAVSVSRIAGDLGMTKGALYKHYKNKREIFDKIVERMYQIDYKRAKEYDVPEERFEKMPEVYQHASIDKLIAFNIAQFDYLTQNNFGSNLRKMLTLEQYRNDEIAQLHKNYFTDGPVAYIEELFRKMIEEGVLKKTDPKLLAIEFYAPFYLLVSISDTLSDKEKIRNLLLAHFKRFTKKNTMESPCQKSKDINPINKYHKR